MKALFMVLALQSQARAVVTSEVLESLEEPQKKEIFQRENEAERYTQNKKKSGVSAFELNEAKKNGLQKGAIKSLKIRSIKEATLEKEEGLGLSRDLVRSTTVEEIRVPTQIPKNTNHTKNAKLKSGEKFAALISGDLIAYKNSKSPIDALVLDGDFKDFKLLGNATMNPQTKRISLEFSRIKSPKGELWDLMAVGKDLDGMLGLNGNRESFYWQYLVAEAVLGTVAGMAEGSQNRSKNMFGSYEDVPSADGALKKGVASGLSKVTDRIGEEVRSAPEYVKGRGPYVIEVLVVD